MEFRITATISEHGHDVANAERVLDAFLTTAPETGPVVEVNSTAGTLSITISVELDDLEQGKHEITRIFIDGLTASGLPATDFIDVELVDVSAGADLQRELAIA